MTKEQEEAIERLEKRIKDNEDYKTTQVWLTDDVSAVYTALNIIKDMKVQEENYKNLIADVSGIAKELGLEEDGTIDEIYAKIKEKDEEIEKLKVENENVWKLNANMSQRHLSDIFRIKKKDKQIDLMADFIDKTGAGRRAFSCTFRKNDECNENGCRYCIKQYFKEIAERKNEE